METKRLYKSRNRKLCGVCAGIAEYFEIDPTVVRVLWIIFALSGCGILAYFIAAIIMEDEPDY